jgi:hypothetical protein
MHRIEVNCETGEITEIPLTEEELKEITPSLPPAPPQAPLTARERLEAAGFSIAELRELLLGADDGGES